MKYRIIYFTIKVNIWMIFKLFRNHAEFVLFFKYSNIIFICYTMMCWCIIKYASNKTCTFSYFNLWLTFSSIFRNCLPFRMSSPPVFSRVLVTLFLVFICFIDRYLSFCTFSFGHCVVCSSIYRFWLPLWYLQTFLISDCLYQLYNFSPISCREQVAF